MSNFKWDAVHPWSSRFCKTVGGQNLKSEKIEVYPLFPLRAHGCMGKYPIWILNEGPIRFCLKKSVAQLLMYFVLAKIPLFYFIKCKMNVTFLNGVRFLVHFKKQYKPETSYFTKNNEVDCVQIPLSTFIPLFSLVMTKTHKAVIDVGHFWWSSPISWRLDKSNGSY